MPQPLLILPSQTRSVFRRLLVRGVLEADAPKLWAACCAATADTQCRSPALARHNVGRRRLEAAVYVPCGGPNANTIFRLWPDVMLEAVSPKPRQHLVLLPCVRAPFAALTAERISRIVPRAGRRYIPPWTGRLPRLKAGSVPAFYRIRLVCRSTREAGTRRDFFPFSGATGKNRPRPHYFWFCSFFFACTLIGSPKRLIKPAESFWS